MQKRSGVLVAEQRFVARPYGTKLALRLTQLGSCKAGLRECLGDSAHDEHVRYEGKRHTIPLFSTTYTHPLLFTTHLFYIVKYLYDFNNPHRAGNIRNLQPTIGTKKQLIWYYYTTRKNLFNACHLWYFRSFFWRILGISCTLYRLVNEL